MENYWMIYFEIFVIFSSLAFFPNPRRFINTNFKATLSDQTDFPTLFNNVTSLKMFNNVVKCY